VTPELQQVLDATPCKHLTFITTKSERPFSGEDFSKQFRAWCDAAGLPTRCSAHGLRKAVARRLAEKGASAHQIAAITGHKTLSEMQRYPNRQPSETRTAGGCARTRIRDASDRNANSEWQTFG
jgi:site-specific recombinase XerD